MGIGWRQTQIAPEKEPLPDGSKGNELSWEGLKRSDEDWQTLSSARGHVSCTATVLPDSQRSTHDNSSRATSI